MKASTLGQGFAVIQNKSKVKVKSVSRPIVFRFETVQRGKMSRHSILVVLSPTLFVFVVSGNACSPLGSGFGVRSSDLASGEASHVVYLSDLPVDNKINGWGPIETNKSNGEADADDGDSLTIAGQTFERGFGVHAPSHLSLKVPAKCHAFSAKIGVDDEAAGKGTVIFQVQGDSQLLFRSDVVRGSEAARPLYVEVVPGTTLSLDVEDAGDGRSYDHADWADAHFICTENNIDLPKDFDENPTSQECAAPTLSAYYVAATGSDSAVGSIHSPFKTLSKAQAVMRTSSIKTTFVREGRYQLEKPLEFSAADNGVTIASYPCERAVVSGGRLLTGFVSNGNGVYSLQTPSNTSLDLMIGNVRQRPATSGFFDPSHPFRSGWFAVADLVDNGKTAYKFKTGDVTEADMIPGIMAQSFAWDRQDDSIVEVDKIDFSTRTIHLKSEVRTPPRDGTFRLLNNPRFLRNTGEFTWARAESRLYVKPKNPATFESEGVVLPELTTLFSLTKVKGVTIRGLTFRDTTSTGPALSLADASDIRIVGNTMENVGYGVRLSRSSDNWIAGNALKHLASSGIDLAIGSNKNKVYANDIRHVGEIHKYVSGISGYGIMENWIAHNDIQYSARYGISIKTWSTETHNERNTIEYNRVLDTCQETADGGAIEMLGRLDVKTGNIIRGNYIERYGGLGTSKGVFNAIKGFGIYLDDKTGGVLVTGNFIKSSPGLAHIYVHAGDYNKIENNVAILNGEDLEFIRLERTVDYATSVGTIVRRNIIYYESPTSDYSFYSSGGDAVVDENLIFRSGRYRDGAGGDAKSIIADPQFVNPAAGDYRLKSSSPAFGLGIKDLEWQKMGSSGFTPTVDRPRLW